MKISTQLTAGAAGIVILGIGSVATVFLESPAHDIGVVSSIKSLQAETQRLVKLELSAKPNDELIAKLDAIVDGLINGNAELGLEKTTEHDNHGDHLVEMQEIQTAWNQLKTDIQQFRTTKNAPASLLSHSEAYYDLTEKAAKLTEDELVEHIAHLKEVELGIFAINLVIIAIIVAASRRITNTLQTFTEDIAHSSDNIASTVERQEANISEQASSVSQTTDTVDQLGASSRQSAAQAEASTISANQALDLAREGAQTVEQTMTGMENLKETVRAIAEQITNLSEQTGQIASVSELVGDLANQTNMLALNAAVEAAHAGEHGKGFGVVAREIRKLADESRKSADRIHNLVTEVQTAMNGAVIVTERGKKTAESSIALAQGTAQSLVGVKDAVNNVFANTQQISETAKLQAISIQEILSAINALNFSATDTAEGMNEVKTSTVKLKEFADKLKAIV
jgi:methyl-accepting chemotaxis protein